MFSFVSVGQSTEGGGGLHVTTTHMDLFELGTPLPHGNPRPTSLYHMGHRTPHLRTLNNVMDLYNITDSDGDSCNDFDCNGFDRKAFLSVSLFTQCKYNLKVHSHLCFIRHKLLHSLFSPQNRKKIGSKSIIELFSFRKS